MRFLLALGVGLLLLALARLAGASYLCPQPGPLPESAFHETVRHFLVRPTCGRVSFPGAEVENRSYGLELSFLEGESEFLAQRLAAMFAGLGGRPERGTAEGLFWSVDFLAAGELASQERIDENTGTLLTAGFSADLFAGVGYARELWVVKGGAGDFDSHALRYRCGLQAGFATEGGFAIHGYLEAAGELHDPYGRSAFTVPAHPRCGALLAYRPAGAYLGRVAWSLSLDFAWEALPKSGPFAKGTAFSLALGWEFRFGPER